MIRKIAAGEYRTDDNGTGIMRTKRDAFYDHNPAFPWVVYTRFYSGIQVEARFRTLAAAKRYVGG